MTVSTVVDHNDYTGNGVTISFPYTFRIFKKTDLAVSVIDLSENITVLVLDTDYTVTNAGGYNGGNVVLTSPLANGWQISIARELEPTQETDLRNQGKFFAEIHEDAFDKLTMLIQQVSSLFRLALRKPSSIANWYDALNNYIRNLKDPRDPQDAATKNYTDNLVGSNFNRTLRVPESSIPQLPPANLRANMIQGFDSAGNPVMLVPQSGSAADVLLQLASTDPGKGDALIAVKQPYTNSVARTQHDVNADYISVKDFGAVGDGVTNDTDAIQAAIVYGKDNKVKVYIPSGVYIVTTLTVYPYTVLEGAGRTTELKLLDGYNGDVIVGVNSYNWFGMTDHHTITNTCYNTELCNFVINGNVTTFDGSRTGNGIAIWGSRLRIWNIDIKNVAESGMRTDYYDNDYDSSEPWYESTFNQIRISNCGHHGWYCAGPHDLQSNDVTIIDGSRVGNNRYDGICITSNCSGNFVNLHASNSSINGGDLLRHRHAGNIEGPCRFAGGTTFEGSASACVRIASSGCQFDDSCAYYAPWGDNTTCYVMQLEGANLSKIRGKIGGPTTERSSSMISVGLRFMASAPTSTADINLMIDGCSMPVTFGNNTTLEQGPDGDGGNNKVVIQAYYSGPISYGIYGQPNTAGRTELDIRLGGKVDQRIMSERQNRRFTMAAGASYQWNYKYRFGSTPILTYSIDSPAAVPTGQVWTVGVSMYSTTFFNNTGTSITVNASVERGLLDV